MLLVLVKGDQHRQDAAFILAFAINHSNHALLINTGSCKSRLFWFGAVRQLSLQRLLSRSKSSGVAAT